MKKIAYIGMAVVLAVAVTTYYRNKESERRQSYLDMAIEVEMALKDMSASTQTKEKLEQRANSFSRAIEVFSTKASNVDLDIIEKLKKAHNHLRLAIDAFPPPITDKEINEQMEEMYRKTKVSLERVDSSRMMLKVDGFELGGGKREEAIQEVAKELEESTALCREVIPGLTEP